MNLVSLVVLSLADCSANEPFDSAGTQMQLRLDKEAGGHSGYYLVKAVVGDSELFVCDDDPDVNSWVVNSDLNSRFSTALCTDAGYDCSQEGACKAVTANEVSETTWTDLVEKARTKSYSEGTDLWVTNINCPPKATTLADCNHDLVGPDSCDGSEAVMLNCGNTCSSSGTKKALSTGAIVGIVAGSLAAVVAVAAAAVALTRPSAGAATLL